MKQKIQIVLFVAMLVAAIRLVIILYERHEPPAQPKKQQGVVPDPDSYVTPRKLYPYDLKSAQQLTRQPVWVKVGYYYPYYPYDPRTHAVRFASEAGKLRPIEKLEIKSVVSVPYKRCDWTQEDHGCICAGRRILCGYDWFAGGGQFQIVF